MIVGKLGRCEVSQSVLHKYTSWLVCTILGYIHDKNIVDVDNKLSVKSQSSNSLTKYCSKKDVLLPINLRTNWITQNILLLNFNNFCDLRIE